MTILEQEPTTADAELDEYFAHPLDCVCDECIENELLMRAEDRAA